MKWLNRFLIFLLIVIVGISVGLSVYYFMLNNEVFSLGGENGQSTTKYVNVGETFVVTVTRENPSADQYSLVSMNEEIVKFKEKFADDKNVESWRFEALAGGNTTIQLVTTNEDYKNVNVAVYVGSGSTENPFYIRDYQDLKSIGPAHPLTANYQQVADIDMSVEKQTAWTPIGGDDGFSGTYNGGKHTISNLHLLQEGSAMLSEGEVVAPSTLKNAGLFGTIKTGAKVSNLNLTGFKLDGNYDNVAPLAAYNMGEVSFVTVSNSVVNANATIEKAAYIGGVVGILDGTSGAYLAKVLYTTVSNLILSANTTACMGGISSVVRAGMISNCGVVDATFATPEASKSSIAGGITASLVNMTAETNDSQKSAVINCYAVIKNEMKGEDFVAGLIAFNLNGLNSVQPELKPDEAYKNYNRILGNFYQKSEKVTTGIYDFDDVTTAYLAYGVTAETLKKKPNAEQFSAVKEANMPSENVAYIGYDVNGEMVTWDFDNLWSIDPSVNNGYPFIKDNAVPVNNGIYDEFDVVVISGKQKLLDELAADLADDGIYNNKYKIDSDIDLTGEEWTPIGDSLTPFNGQMYGVAKADGSMPVIRNLVITTENRFNGFFGMIGSEGVAENLIIEGVKITKVASDDVYAWVGAIAGLNYGKIIDCVVRSNADTNFEGININADNRIYAGGIAGKTGKDALIQDCTASLNIKVQSKETNFVGGIVGELGGNSKIVNSNYDGGLTSDGKYAYEIFAQSDTDATAGGIVGVSSDGSISKCNFTGKINASVSTGDKSYVGGITGYSGDGTLISDCSATSMEISGYYAGGLVGWLEGEGSENLVSTSYATGFIGGEKVGGLASVIVAGSIVNCYAECTLAGKVMAGFAVDIEIQNKDRYGRVAYCFANSEFDYSISGSKAYAETKSEVYSVHNPFTAIFGEDNKVAGVVEKCIVNSKHGGTRLTSSYNFVIDWASPDDGWTSDENCKKMSTFTNRGFDSKYWNFVQDQYPTLVQNS
ncbi:MAG: hypothetical protein IJ301_05350 [Clostridia bacterium]|nr:hypothetical protein [Clostridia bacterium]